MMVEKVNHKDRTDRIEGEIQLAYDALNQGRPMRRYAAERLKEASRGK